VAEQHSSGGTASTDVRPSFLHRLEHLAVVSVVAVARVLPMRAVLAAGTLLGRAFYIADRAHRRLAIRNLQAAFPVRNEQECRAIAREMFSHFGRLLAVLLKFSTMTPARMLEHVEFTGEERVTQAHAQGRGVLLITGHFGFWEINALVHALAIRPMALLARPLDNPLLHDLLESVRRKTGNSTICSSPSGGRPATR
jgi:KDO2-lipid IV(A) lauroyltransferase